IADCTTTNIISGISVTVAGPYYVGDTCSNNYLEINSGGSLTNTDGIIGNTATANNNSVLVSGPGSEWYNSGNLYAGNTGSVNRLTIQNGGRVDCNVGLIGYASN